MIVKGKRKAEFLLGKKLSDPKYTGRKYFVLSETGERLFGGYKTEAEAKKRLGQVEYFKRRGNPSPTGVTWSEKVTGDKVVRRFETDGGYLEVWENSPFAQGAHSVVDFVVEDGRRGQGIGGVLVDAVLYAYPGEEISAQVSSLASLKLFFNKGFTDGESSTFAGLKKEWDYWGGSLNVRRPGTVRNPKSFSGREGNPRKVLYIKPNAAAVKAAARGLAARSAASKSNKGGLDGAQAKAEGVGSGVMRARDITSGKRVNAYQVKAFFDRHRGNYLAAKDKGLKPEKSRAIQAWLLWGGNPLYYQAQKAVEKDSKSRRRKASSNPQSFSDKEHDWDEVLIQSGGKKHTRAQIADYYRRNAKKIWPYLKGQTVMVLFARAKNDIVLRRKGPDGKHIKLTKLKGIDDPHSFEYWVNRRAIEFHPVITGKTTGLIWIDVDPYKKARGKSMAKMQRHIRQAVPLMKRLLKDEFGVTTAYVWRSGKTDGGWHVEGDLPRKMNVDKMRTKLRAALDTYFADDPGFTTGIARPGQIRLDTTLTKTLGSLRAPYSYTVDGGQKLPVSIPGIAPPLKAKRKAKRNPELTNAEYKELKRRVAMGKKGLHVALDYDPIGVGGSRMVYEIVLKGRAPFAFKADMGPKELPTQTKMEVDCMFELKNELAPEIYAYDEDNYRWVEMEILDPMEPDVESRTRFKKLTGIKWDDFEFAFEDIHEDVSPELRATIRSELVKNQRSSAFIDSVLDLVEHCALAPYELSVIENWGTTRDGRHIKLLDLGG